MGSCGPPLPTGRGACGPPLPLDQNFETLSNIFLWVESHCFDERKDVSSLFKPNLNLIKINQKLVGSCGPPLPTGRGACGPPLPPYQNFETL